jgi:uncharacterized protein (TIGR02118 family)
MHKILVLYPYPQDEKKFRPYYETKHMALVARMPGILGYRFSFDVNGAGPGAAKPFYCVFEADFADTAGFVKAVESEEGRAVREDAPNFSTTPPTVANYTVSG